MAKLWTVLGDRTTGGGSIITAAPQTDINGVKIARLHDKATCPRHKGIFSIVSGCDATIIIDGQPVALDGARLSCGCSVIAGSQNLVFVEHGSPASISTHAQACCRLQRLLHRIQGQYRTRRPLATMRRSFFVPDSPAYLSQTRATGSSVRTEQLKREELTLMAGLTWSVRKALRF